jgi:trehalose 6-phosphate phosphatase
VTGEPSSKSEPLPRPRPDWAYFLDVDGTLLDFAVRPDAVRADGAVGELVDRLVARAGGAVALISGRPIADIDRFFPGRQLPVAGQHGAERRNAAGDLSHRAPESDRLAVVRELAHEAIARHPALILEDKGASIAMHYRAAPELADYVRTVTTELQQMLGDGWCVQAGKCVVEIVPVGVDKGAAILAFLAEAPFRGRTPVFIGDDRTDEHGFAAVNARGGYSIKVGAGATVAQARLPSVLAVHRWLDQDATAPLPDIGLTRVS